MRYALYVTCVCVVCVCVFKPSTDLLEVPGQPLTADMSSGQEVDTKADECSVVLITDQHCHHSLSHIFLCNVFENVLWKRSGKEVMEELVACGHFLALVFSILFLTNKKKFEF